MPSPSRLLRTFLLTGLAAALGHAYPLPSRCKDDPGYIQGRIKDSQGEFNQTYLEDFAFSQEGHLKLFTSVADWEAKRDSIKQAAMADATFTGLLAAYRGQLASYRELLALYETCRQQTNADPSNQAKKATLEGVKSSRNLVYEGMKNTYAALVHRWATLRRAEH